MGYDDLDLYQRLHDDQWELKWVVRLLSFQMNR